MYFFLVGSMSSHNYQIPISDGMHVPTAPTERIVTVHVCLARTLFTILFFLFMNNIFLSGSNIKKDLGLKVWAHSEGKPILNSAANRKNCKPKIRTAISN